MTTMTIDQARDKLRAAENSANGPTLWPGECGDIADAICSQSELLEVYKGVAIRVCAILQEHGIEHLDDPSEALEVLLCDWRQAMQGIVDYMHEAGMPCDRAERLLASPKAMLSQRGEVEGG